MNTEQQIVDAPDAVVDSAPDVVVDAAPANDAPQLDLSAVPEKVRGHVDADRYQTDTDYKQAIEHGWKPKEVFLSEGGDEADWTGYKVFNKRHRDWELRKEQQREISEMKKNTDAILRTFEEEKQRAIEQALQQRQAALKVAIDDGDAARAVEIQRELDSFEKNKPAPAHQNVEPLSVEIARKRNPFINPAHPEFNAELNKEFERICSEEAKDQWVRRGRQPLNDAQIQLIVEDALSMVKDKIKPKAAPQPPAKAPSAAKPASSASGGSKPKMSADQKKFYDRMLTLPNGKVIADNYLKNINA
jgi:hypothetical protein